MRLAALGALIAIMGASRTALGADLVGGAGVGGSFMVGSLGELILDPFFSPELRGTHYDRLHGAASINVHVGLCWHPWATAPGGSRPTSLYLILRGGLDYYPVPKDYYRQQTSVVMGYADVLFATLIGDQVGFYGEVGSGFREAQLSFASDLSVLPHSLYAVEAVAGVGVGLKVTSAMRLLFPFVRVALPLVLAADTPSLSDEWSALIWFGTELRFELHPTRSR